MAARADGTGAHPHRPHILRARMPPAIDPTMPEPHQRRRAAECRGDAVSVAELLTGTSPRSVEILVPTAKQATVTSVPSETGVTTNCAALVKVPGRSSVTLPTDRPGSEFHPSSSMR